LIAPKKVRDKFLNFLIKITYPKPKFNKRWKTLDYKNSPYLYISKSKIDKSFEYKNLLFKYNIRFVKYSEEDETVTVHISRLSVLYRIACKIIPVKKRIKWNERLMVLNLGVIFQQNTTLDDVFDRYNIPDYMLCEERMRIHMRKQKINNILDE
jgi:hypothetical protein